MLRPRRAGLTEGASHALLPEASTRVKPHRTMPQKGRMTHILIQEGRSTHQLKTMCLFPSCGHQVRALWSEQNIQHVDFGGILGTLDAVLIRVWS